MNRRQVVVLFQASRDLIDSVLIGIEQQQVQGVVVRLLLAQAVQEFLVSRDRGVDNHERFVAVRIERGVFGAVVSVIRIGGIRISGIRISGIRVGGGIGGRIVRGSQLAGNERCRIVVYVNRLIDVQGGTQQFRCNRSGTEKDPLLQLVQIQLIEQAFSGRRGGEQVSQSDVSSLPECGPDHGIAHGFEKRGQVVVGAKFASAVRPT